MSGGSYDYQYSRLRDLADMLKDHAENPRETPLTKEECDRRLRLSNLLDLAAEAARMFEWYESGDTGPEDEIPAFEALAKHCRNFGD